MVLQLHCLRQDPQLTGKEAHDGREEENRNS
jgi:hypothetical protein